MSIFESSAAAITGGNEPQPGDSSWDAWETYRQNFGRRPQPQEIQRGTGKTATSGAEVIIVSADAGQKVRKPSPARTDEAAVEEVPPSNKKGEELKAELDSVLDEIDEVLEANGTNTAVEAEAFVKSYVQKGGE